MKKTLLAAMAMVSLCAHAQLPIEGFESPWTGTPAAPPGWTVVNEAGPAVTWSQTPANSLIYQANSGSHAAFLDKESVPTGSATPRDWLITPVFNVPVNALNYSVRFFSSTTIAGDQGGVYKVMVGTDPANLSSFTEIYSATELQLVEYQTEYSEKIIGIPAAYSGTNIHIAFVMEGNDADRWVIDDVSLIDACVAPVNITVSASTINSATYTWNDTGAISYDYLLTTSTNPPLNSAIPTGSVPTPTVTAAPLEIGVNYYFYVRGYCANGGISPWSASYPEIPVPVDNNIFIGRVVYDANADGICSNDDPGIPYVEVQVSINGADPFSVFTNDAGQYKLYSIEDGVTNLSLQVVTPQFFAAQPPLEQQITFTDEIDAVAVTHCLSQPSAGSDLSVLVIPVNLARPGLPAAYRIIAHNAGSTVQENVMLNLSFDDDRIDYASSEYINVAPTQGNLAINLGTIQPYSVNNGTITFNVNIPPVNMGGEVLHFEAVLSEVTDDVTPENNTSVLNQTIVNSYDPNDITVHEGAEIYEDQADDYLTYTIRFQNTGTADAINIKLENTLDALLDWETFKPLVSSHNYTVKRTDDFLEFEYDKIHLPDSTSNEPGSHGYITYKVKPKAGFGIGDIVSNTAEIYFDFNPAIVTNTATTTVIALAGLNDNKVAVARLYPNPVKDQLMVDVVNGDFKSATIHDVNGRLCLTANANVIDTNALTGGIYFVKVTTDAGSANYKIIKQ